MNPLNWMNAHEGLAGWVSGLGAFAAAMTAIWAVRWQNLQHLKEINDERRLAAGAQEADRRLRRWLLATSARPALQYVEARVTATRAGAVALDDIQHKRTLVPLPRQIDDTAWAALKIDLPRELLDHIKDFSLFGGEVGSALGQFVAYARLLNSMIDTGKSYDRRPAPDELIRRTDELLHLISIAKPALERVVQAGPPVRNSIIARPAT